MNEEEIQLIKNLEKYIKEDVFYNETEKIESDFDRFCYNHCKDIDNALDIVERQAKEIKEKQTIIYAGADKIKILEKEIEELTSDNYELNNRINDLLDSVPKQKIKDKIEELDGERYKDFINNKDFLLCHNFLAELLEEQE